MMSDETDKRSAFPSSDLRTPDLGTDVSGAVGKLSDATRDTLATARDEAAKIGEELKTQASDLGAEANKRAQGFLDDQKVSGADQVDGIARAVNRAADELDRSAPQLAGYVREAANAAANLSRSLRDRSSGELMQDVGDFARRSPAAFFGSAMVVGLALSRFLKSSSEHAAGPANTGRALESSGMTGVSGSSYAPAPSEAPAVYQRYAAEDSTAAASEVIPGRGRTNP